VLSPHLLVAVVGILISVELALSLDPPMISAG
jgi:hypothetical protein